MKSGVGVDEIPDPQYGTSLTFRNPKEPFKIHRECRKLTLNHRPKR